MTCQSDIQDTRPLRLMPREMRLMSERIFSLSQMPRGYALTLTDIPMLSQYLGLGGFDLLLSGKDRLLAADPKALSITSEASEALTLDFAGQPAWTGLYTLLDLAAEKVADHSRAVITVTGAADAEELAVAALLGLRIGLAIEISASAEGAVVTATQTEINDDANQALDRDGAMVSPAIWWEIYEIARSALAPDTAVSRRHAGVQIINEDGTVIGRTDNDDDADVNFLARGAREQA